MGTNKTKKMFRIAALLLAVFALGIVGFAQGKGGGEGWGDKHARGRGRGHDGPMRMLRGLDLTEAQQAQVKQIAERFQQSTATLREQMKANRGSQASMFTDGTFNEAAVRAAAQADAATEVELRVARARMMSEIYQVLTPEQKAKIAERRQQMQQRRQERQQRRAERGKAAPAVEQ